MDTNIQVQIIKAIVKKELIQVNKLCNNLLHHSNYWNIKLIKIDKAKELILHHKNNK